MTAFGESPCTCTYDDDVDDLNVDRHCPIHGIDAEEKLPMADRRSYDHDLPVALDFTPGGAGFTLPTVIEFAAPRTARGAEYRTPAAHGTWERAMRIANGTRVPSASEGETSHE